MSMRPGVALASMAIAGYQRYVSPYKGFRCAHGALHGGPGCSEAVRRLIRTHGLVAAWPRIRERFHSAVRRRWELRSRALAAVAVQEEPTGNKGTKKKKGDGCDGCDLPCDIPCDMPCDLPCDWGF